MLTLLDVKKNIYGNSHLKRNNIMGKHCFWNGYMVLLKKATNAFGIYYWAVFKLFPNEMPFSLYHKLGLSQFFSNLLCGG